MIVLVTNQTKIYQDFKVETVEESLEYLNNLDWIGVDTETTGFNPHQDSILSLQLGDYDRQYYIDNSIDFKEYKQLLESKNLILQNAQFDHRFFYKLGIYPLKIWDTFIAETCITLGNNYSPKDLGAIADKYIGKDNHDVDKSQRGLVHKLDILNPQVIRYGCNDVKYLPLIKEEQIKVCNELDILESVVRECNFTPALAYIAYCGLYVDTNKWLKKVKESKIKLEASYKALDDWYINNPNMNRNNDGQMLLFTDELCPVKWSSSDQVIPILKMEGVDVTVVEKGEKKETSGEKHLQKYKGNFEIVDLLLEYRHWQTDISKYGENFLRFIDKETGRIHTTFRQVLSTGRISSGKSKKGKYEEEEYPNLQNIPSDDRTRSCFTPQNSNNVIIDADYSGQEDIVFVNYSLEKKLIDFYKGDFSDGHSYVAKMCFPTELFNIEMKDVKKKRPDLRFKAKSAKFAIHYGGDGFTIASNLGLTPTEGKEIYESYLKAFPDIDKYFTECETNSLNTGYILISPVTKRKFFLTDLSKDLLGFKPFYFKSFEDWKNQGKLLNNKFWTRYKEEKAKNSFWFENKKAKVREYFRIKSSIRKTSLNFPIQGSSAELTKLAAARFFKWIVENNFIDTVKMINMIHDEIMVECPRDISKDIAIKLQYFMEDSGKEYCPIIPLKAIPEITEYWKH